MTKKFTESIFILIVLNLLVKPFYIFGIERNVQNLVGAEVYGHFFSLLSFSLLFNIVSDFGITNFNNRSIAQNHDQLSIQIGNLIPLKIIFGLIYCAFTLSVAFYIGYSNDQFKLLILLIINQLIISFTLYLRSNISGLQFFNIDSLISIIDKLLLIIICSFLLWGKYSKFFEIEWFIYAMSFSYLMSLLTTLFILLKKTGYIKLRLQYKITLELLKQSLPYALLMFLMMAYTRIDSVLLERLLPQGEIQVGVYAQAFRITDALSMFAFLFASILLPLFAKMIKDRASLTNILGHSFGMLLIPSIGLIVALYFYSNEFMDLLYNYHAGESAIALKYLIIGYLGICLNYIFGTLLTASGNIKILNWIALAGFILNIILNLILIPYKGASGAAASNMITQLAMGILQISISYKIFNITFKYQYIIKYSLLILLVLGLAIFFHSLTKNWFLPIIAIPFFSVVLGFLLQLLKIDNFKMLFTNQ